MNHTLVKLQPVTPVRISASTYLIPDPRNGKMMVTIMVVTITPSSPLLSFSHFISFNLEQKKKEGAGSDDDDDG